MELVQEEIVHSDDNIHLAWTPGSLLSPAVMTKVRAKREKWPVSMKITITSEKEKDQIIRDGILFRGERPQADNFGEISPNTLCLTCCHWGHIILYCLQAE